MIDNTSELNKNTRKELLEENITAPKKLEELLLDLKRGIQISTSKLMEQKFGKEESKCRLITNSDIEDCYITDDTDKKTVEIDLKKQKQFMITESNVILLTKTGPNFKVGITKCADGEKYLVSNNLYALKVNDKIIKPYYLLYFLNSKAGKELLKNHSVGSKVPVLTSNDVYNLEIPIPSDEIQGKISEEMISTIESIKAAKSKYKEGLQKLENIDKMFISSFLKKSL